METFSTGKHKINHISLNSLSRQALTGIDRCSDGGMRMSHVFSIIYTALLFLSPPLRQVSILLHRNQSVICQTLSIRRLIYVSYCGWLHASATAGKEQMGRERHSARRHQVLWRNEKSSFLNASADSRHPQSSGWSCGLNCLMSVIQQSVTFGVLHQTHQRWHTWWDFKNLQTVQLTCSEEKLLEL